MTNSEQYPEAWAFYIKQARNISAESDLVALGNYRIPMPNSTIIYANTVEELWCKFIKEWQFRVYDCESLYNKIQYIVTHF